MDPNLTPPELQFLDVKMHEVVIFEHEVRADLMPVDYPGRGRVYHVKQIVVDIISGAATLYLDGQPLGDPILGVGEVDQLDQIFHQRFRPLYEKEVNAHVQARDRLQPRDP